MKYSIEYRYKTGDSFKSLDLNGTLEASWVSLEKAKENLKRIYEHYIYYLSNNCYNYYKLEKILKIDNFTDKHAKNIQKEAKNKSWYCQKYSEHCLKLILDNENEFEISAPWIGYFERLYWAKINIKNEGFEIKF